MASVGRSLVESEGALYGLYPVRPGPAMRAQGRWSRHHGRGRTRCRHASDRDDDGPFDRTGAPVETPNRKKVFMCRTRDPRRESACASRIVATWRARRSAVR